MYDNALFYLHVIYWCTVFKLRSIIVIAYLNITFQKAVCWYSALEGSL